jgi:toxin YoeB
MIYNILIKREAEDDIQKHNKSGQRILIEKIYSFIAEIIITPRTGTGKPEQLKRYGNEDKYPGIDFWSRRIDKKHRFTYSINEENKTIEVLSVWGHYQDT